MGYALSVSIYFLIWKAKLTPLCRAPKWSNYTIIDFKFVQDKNRAFIYHFFLWISVAFIKSIFQAIIIRINDMKENSVIY